MSDLEKKVVSLKEKNVETKIREAYSRTGKIVEILKQKIMSENGIDDNTYKKCLYRVEAEYPKHIWESRWAFLDELNENKLLLSDSLEDLSKYAQQKFNLDSVGFFAALDVDYEFQIAFVFKGKEQKKEKFFPDNLLFEYIGKVSKEINRVEKKTREEFNNKKESFLKEFEDVPLSLKEYAIKIEEDKLNQLFAKKETLKVKNPSENEKVIVQQKTEEILKKYYTHEQQIDLEKKYQSSVKLEYKKEEVKPEDMKDETVDNIFRTEDGVYKNKTNFKWILSIFAIIVGLSSIFFVYQDRKEKCEKEKRVQDSLFWVNTNQRMTNEWNTVLGQANDVYPKIDYNATHQRIKLFRYRDSLTKNWGDFERKDNLCIHTPKCTYKNPPQWKALDTLNARKFIQRVSQYINTSINPIISKN